MIEASRRQQRDRSSTGQPGGYGWSTLAVVGLLFMSVAAGSWWLTHRSANVATTQPGGGSSSGAPSARTNNTKVAFVGGRLTPTRSRMPWASGAFISGGINEQTIAPFERWRGRPLDVVVEWGPRGSWDELTSSTFVYETWKGTPQAKIFGVGMLPERVPGVTLQACAAGEYNDHWQTFGAQIASYDLGTVVIRLGWEFNGDWYLWKASDPAAYAGCWRQIVTTVRMKAPGLLWDWTVNRSPGKGLADPTKAWPGDGYVDVVGIDSYDQWPPATNSASWKVHATASNQGLQYWLNFAKEHGKKLSVPEWGSMRSGGNPGDDNPYYVTQMLQFFRANASMIAYEANFQDGPVAQGGTGGSYYVDTTVPRAAAVYRAAYR